RDRDPRDAEIVGVDAALADQRDVVEPRPVSGFGRAAHEAVARWRAARDGRGLDAGRGAEAFEKFVTQRAPYSLGPVVRLRQRDTNRVESLGPEARIRRVELDHPAR